MQTAPKILLVEDNDDHVVLFKRAARASGLQAELEHADNGQAAVEYLSNQRFTATDQSEQSVIIVLDIKLPLMDGFEVLQWLGSKPEIGKSVCPILLTSSEAPEDRQRARELGVREYWLKPSSLVGYEVLMEQLRQRLGERPRMAGTSGKRPAFSGGVKRLLTRTGLKQVLLADPIQVNLDDTYEVYALIWEAFRCDKCGREDSYRAAADEFVKELWLPLAAKAARADGWHVGPWDAEGCMDCTAYCPECGERA